MSNNDLTLTTPSYAGLFLVSMASLMYEVLLTRIFSAAMWYYFAFMAVAVAMFGMTLGAVLIYLFPAHFTPQRAKRHLSASTLLFALTSIGAFVVYLSIPLPQDYETVQAAATLIQVFLLIAIPFTFSGISVCTALTHFPGQISKLYAADLGGAAIGCVLIPLTLNVTDGPTAVLIIACVACLASLLFALDARQTRLVRAAIACGVLLGAASVAHAVGS